MSAEVIAWLRSPEGEAWSRGRAVRELSSPAPRMWQMSPGDPAEDPTGRGPIGDKDAATGTGG